jgi:hypothetical protein
MKSWNTINPNKTQQALIPGKRKLAPMRINWNANQLHMMTIFGPSWKYNPYPTWPASNSISPFTLRGICLKSKSAPERESA